MWEVIPPVGGGLKGDLPVHFSGWLDRTFGKLPAGEGIMVGTLVDDPRVRVVVYRGFTAVVPVIYHGEMDFMEEMADRGLGVTGKGVN